MACAIVSGAPASERNASTSNQVELASFQVTDSASARNQGVLALGYAVLR
jgi:hypothetical protein